jgi:hypothetical protein
MWTRSFRSVVIFLLVVVFLFVQNPIPARADINTSNRWVMGGAAGVKYSDNDGTSWTTASGDHCASVAAVAHNESIWLAGGSLGCLESSTDGDTWTQLAYTGISTITAIAWNGSRWVIGGNGDKIAYSTNGVDFTAAATPVLGQVLGIGSNGSRFVAAGTALGGNSIAYSDDGDTWTGAGDPFNIHTGRAVAYNGSRWVVGGGTSRATALQYSDNNGVSWSAATLPGSLTTGNIFNIAWNGTRFVAVNNFDNGVDTTPWLYSSDGITWTAVVDTGCVSICEGHSVGWNGTVFLAGGASGTNKLSKSSDGITWTNLGSPIADVMSLSGAPAPSLYPAQIVATPTPAAAAGGGVVTGTLIATVRVSGGPRTANDFSLFLGGSLIVSGNSYSERPGTYIISETPVSGYAITYSGACSASGSVTITGGGTKECIVTNTYLSTPAPTPAPTPIPSASATPIVSPSTTPTPAPTPTPQITPVPNVSVIPFYLTPVPSESPPEPQASGEAIAQGPEVAPFEPSTETPSSQGGVLESIGNVVAAVIDDAFSSATVAAHAIGDVCGGSAAQAASCSTAAAATTAAVAGIAVTVAQNEVVASSHWLSQVVGLRRKTRVWGSIYDSATKRPVPFAKAVLFDASGRVLETRFADRDGRYGFLTSLRQEEMAVSIRVEKSGYQYPSRTVTGTTDAIIYDRLYHGGPLMVSKTTVLNFNIPIDPLAATRSTWSGRGVSLIGTLGDRILNICFYLGLVAVPWSVYQAPTRMHLVILGLFISFNAFRLLVVYRPYARVIDAKTGKSLSYVLVTLNDPAGKRISFSVSDEYGRCILSGPKDSAYDVIAYTPANIQPPRTTRFHLSKLFGRGWVKGTIRL